MGITAQFCELLQVREVGLQIGEETPGGDAVADHGTGSQCGGQSLDTGIKKFTEWKVGERGGFFRKSPLEILLRADQAGLQGMACGNQVLEKTPELVQILLPRAIGQGWILSIEPANPAEHMRIAAQFR